MTDLHHGDAATHVTPDDIHALPAQWLERGFRLLMLRQLHAGTTPPAFARIEQRLLRTPERLSRHGLYFACTFRPEIMTWLSEHLGRPSVRQGEDGSARRNASWPDLKWHGESREWMEGHRTTEWFVDVIFPIETHWTLFQQRWLNRLMGRDEGERSNALPGVAAIHAHDA